MNGKQVATGSCQNNIFTNRQHEEMEKILNNLDSLSWEHKVPLYNKKDILSLLYDISDTYEAAREAFIHYKMLIDTVKEGYIAFSKDCCPSMVKHKFDEYKKLDKNRKKDSPVFIGTSTFEKTYKLGVIEWMNVANEKFDNQLAFWNRLIKIENAKKSYKSFGVRRKWKHWKSLSKKDKNRLQENFRKQLLKKRFSLRSILLAFHKLSRKRKIKVGM
ncbi:hypothetical protein [Bartonella harrusi]|uniref:Plasmodium RESA N-terminal domain-containing protein n=1 Tax=Bartonella harrusi TaxID=2961895 RepID=A0ABY5ES63_9HYPH|nr:hypothetical protein [Bartonella harrusi]UTO28246.1 hypothetical protein NMK50_08880 [Bartonella harrusi]